MISSLIHQGGLLRQPDAAHRAALIFNIRMDPFESYDNKDSYGHLMQKVSWLIAPMGELIAAHLKTLKDYPPVQCGKSFDMSNVVQEVECKQEVVVSPAPR